MAKQKSTRNINRREFIKHTALVSGGVALLPGMLTSCADDDDDLSYGGDFGFREGVASFDLTAAGSGPNLPRPRFRRRGLNPSWEVMPPPLAVSSSPTRF